MKAEEIFDYARATFGDDVSDFHADPKKDKDPWFVCKADRVVALCTWLRDETLLAFDYLECVTGTDYPEKQQIHVTFHVYSYARKHRVVFKALLARDAPKMPTLASVWPTAVWQERECFDLLGVIFEGHPDLRRLLLPDDWIGHPLRKDFKEQASYAGIPTTRPYPIDLLQIQKKPAGSPGAA